MPHQNFNHWIQLALSLSVESRRLSLIPSQAHSKLISQFEKLLASHVGNSKDGIVPRCYDHSKAFACCWVSSSCPPKLITPRLWFPNFMCLPLSQPLLCNTQKHIQTVSACSMWYLPLVTRTNAYLSTRQSCTNILHHTVSHLSWRNMYHLQFMPFLGNMDV